MSNTCFTRAGFFASWLNSLAFQSDFAYTNWASAIFTAPIAASPAALVPALTNSLRLILLIWRAHNEVFAVISQPPGALAGEHQELFCRNFAYRICIQIQMRLNHLRRQMPDPVVK